MSCPDADRMTELKYGDYVQQVIARMKSLPEGVWSCFAGRTQSGDSAPVEGPDPVVEQICREVIGSCPEPELKLLWLGTEALWKPDDENPDSRAVWEEGVVRELYERVTYAAGDAALDGDEKEEPGGIASEARFRFDEDELAFLSKVARQLVLLTARRGVTPEQAKAIRRAVAALKRLPEPSRGIDVLIEVSHRMGSEEFSEHYLYTIALEQERIAITSSGSQHDPRTGTNSFDLESFEWRADGQIAQKGDRDPWLERLAYALGRDYTLNVTDKSVSGASGSQAPPAEA